MEKTKIQEMAENASQRSNIYRFLAAVYHKEVSPELLRQIRDPQFMKALSEIGINFGDEFLSGSEDEIIQNLAVEYTKLFLGPGKHVAPFESVHHERADGDWGRLWGADTATVNRFIEATGLEFQSDYEGLPDHITVELELMQKVTSREAQAWEDEDEESALYCLQIEKRFIEEHLSEWIPVFCEKVIAEATMPFYQEVTEITRDFIELDEKEINKSLSEAEKHPPDA